MEFSVLLLLFHPDSFDANQSDKRAVDQKNPISFGSEDYDLLHMVMYIFTDHGRGG